MVLCPPITQQLIANFRVNGLHKPRQYSHYLPLDDITTRQNDCDTVSNYPRQADLGHEGNMCGSIIYEYKASPRGRHSPIRTGPPRPTAFAGYWLTIAHESSRTNPAGRPRRQYLVLPDDPHRLPDRVMRVECRRHKVATSNMHLQANLATVRTSLDSATAAQSYHQAQILQLSQELAQLREQLKTLTEKQTVAHHDRGNIPLNPTAATYRPQSHTPPSGGSAPLPEKTKDPSRPLTGVVHVSPEPGTPASSTTPPPLPALPRARSMQGGFAAAFKTAVSKSKIRSSPATPQPTRGSPSRAGTSTPTSTPTTELTPPASGHSAGEALKQMLDLAQVRGYLDSSEGDY